MTSYINLNGKEEDTNRANENFEEAEFRKVDANSERNGLGKDHMENIGMDLVGTKGRCL